MKFLNLREVSDEELVENTDYLVRIFYPNLKEVGWGVYGFDGLFFISRETDANNPFEPNSDMRYFEIPDQSSNGS